MRPVPPTPPWPRPARASTPASPTEPDHEPSPSKPARQPSAACRAARRRCLRPGGPGPGLPPEPRLGACAGRNRCAAERPVRPGLALQQPDLCARAPHCQLEATFDADPQLAALTVDLIEEVTRLRRQLQQLQALHGDAPA